jgi:hypothetical protein
MSARKYLEHIYLDWVNNYLTVEGFAEDLGITMKQAVTLIKIAREVFESDHPEA